MSSSMPTLRSEQSSRRNWPITLFILVFLGFAAVGLCGWLWLSSWAVSEISLTGPKEILLSRGESARSFAKKCETEGLVSDATIFYIYLRTLEDFSKFQAGLFQFTENVTPTKIAQKIKRGEIYEPIVLRYTIPEGFTAKKFALRLEANGVGPASEFFALFSDVAYLNSLKIPGKHKNIEGFLYPATYAFQKTITPKIACSEAVKTFWQQLPPNFEERAEKLGLSLYEAVIFASLIELETKFDDERSKVSEVIWRRLKNREPLAIDAALIYGIKDYKGDITWKHLKDRSNPYNTRLRAGLPPTPIGSPSKDSLAAVFEPSDLGYYYYVLDLDQGERHHFSKTHDEHKRYVKKLVKQLKKRQMDKLDVPTNQ